MVFLHFQIDMAGVTKEQRTKIHDAVKKAFGETIVGSTVNIEDKKLMRFQKYRKGGTCYNLSCNCAQCVWM